MPVLNEVASILVCDAGPDCTLRIPLPESVWSMIRKGGHRFSEKIPL
jgi:hypothetical protein